MSLLHRAGSSTAATTLRGVASSRASSVSSSLFASFSSSSRHKSSRTLLSSQTSSSSHLLSQSHRLAPSLSSSSSIASFSMRSGPSAPHTKIASFVDPVYSTRASGTLGTLDYRVYIQREGKDISAWHDIPLLAKGSSHLEILFHYVNEIPKGTRPKYEIATKEVGNPIKQDVKKSHLRQFTYGDLPFNYGCLPQTWESPFESHPLTKMKGDNDPLDVIEISATPIPVGAVRTVKVLGILGLLDEGETDWKVVAVDASHALASQLKSTNDIDVHFPGLLSSIVDWFRYYKTTDGKPVNQFALDEKIMDVGFTQSVIWSTHAAWANLCKGEVQGTELWIPKEVPKAAKGE